MSRMSSVYEHYRTFPGSSIDVITNSGSMRSRNMSYRAAGPSGKVIPRLSDRQRTSMSRAYWWQKDLLMDASMKLDPQSWLAIKRANRQDDGRDLQTIITARNSSTGTGKTTLALWLALSWDRWGFDDTKTTLHPAEYKNRVIECKPGEVLIMDEAEQIDARRSMSNVNVDLSQMLMQTRYLQVDSIFTLPTISMLDKRLIEKADVWINVIEPGLAVVHEITVEDYSGDINRIPKEELTWPDISQHPLKLSLDRAKARLVEEGEEFNQDQGEVVDVDKKLQEQRNDMLKKVYEHSEMSQRDIAKMEDLSVSRINEIVNA